MLNTLIENNNDRIEGYETASNETEEQDLKTLFAQLSQTIHKCKNEKKYIILISVVIPSFTPSHFEYHKHKAQQLR